MLGRVVVRASGRVLGELGEGAAFLARLGGSCSYVTARSGCRPGQPTAQIGGTTHPKPALPAAVQRVLFTFRAPPAQRTTAWRTTTACICCRDFRPVSFRCGVWSLVLSAPAALSAQGAQLCPSSVMPPCAAALLDCAQQSPSMAPAFPPAQQRPPAHAQGSSSPIRAIPLLPTLIARRFPWYKPALWRNLPHEIACPCLKTATNCPSTRLHDWQKKGICATEVHPPLYYTPARFRLRFSSLRPYQT